MKKWRAIKANRVNSPYDILGGDPDREDYESIIARHMTKETADWIVEQHNSQTEPCEWCNRWKNRNVRIGEILGHYEIHWDMRVFKFCPDCGRALPESGVSK